MSDLKKLYNEAVKNLEDGTKVGLYPLPKDEVCGFDLPLMEGIKLFIEQDYGNKGRFRAVVLLEQKFISTLHIRLANNLTYEQVRWITTIVKALQNTQEPEIMEEV